MGSVSYEIALLGTAHMMSCWNIPILVGRLGIGIENSS